MPISSTLRRLDGGIYINADGLLTDSNGIPVGGSGSGGTANLTVRSTDPEGVFTGTQGDFVYNSVDKKLWIKDTAGTGLTGWLQLI